MESPKRVKFPYSTNVLEMPNGPDKILAKAKERARTYRLRTKQRNATRKLSRSPVLNTESHARIISNARTNMTEGGMGQITPDTPDVGGAGAAAVGGAGTGTERTLLNSITFTEPIPITPFIEMARRDSPASTLAMLRGEACEIFAEKYLPCKQCGSKDWIKAKRGQTAFDLTCSVCKTKYQIKGASRSHIKPTKGTCEILCGRFPGVFECHKNTSGLDYYLFTYTDTHITNIYYVNHTSICANTNLFRHPVKKAGQESKNYCMIKIGKDKCVQIM
jgi:hypothetical protein